LRRDREVQHLLLAYPPSIEPSDQQIDDWIASRTKEPGGAFLSIIDERDHTLGFVQVSDVHRRGRHGKLGIAIASDARGKGVAGKALALLLAHARGSLGLRKLLLEVRADNAPAIRLYGAAGFRQVGILESHYDDGRDCHDVIVMERAL